MLAAALAVVATLSACQVATDVDLQVRPDGSGTVTVVVALDREAAAQIPDLATQLRVADLRRAGWRLNGPAPTAGGGLRVSATKGFGRPGDAGAVLQELAGKDGPFREFAVSRSHSFARTTWSVRGTVDLHDGLGAFRDQRLTALLGGMPFGRPEQDLVRLAHGSLSAAAPFRVTVHLPGANPRSYQVRLGDPALPIDAASRQTRSSAYLLIGAAVVAVLAAAAAWLLGGRPRRRPRRTERGMGTYQRQRYEAITETEPGPAPGAGGPPELVRLRRAPKPQAARPRRPRRPPEA